jgi:hypothetical protein
MILISILFAKSKSFYKNNFGEDYKYETLRSTFNTRAKYNDSTSKIAERRKG